MKREAVRERLLNSIRWLRSMIPFVKELLLPSYGFRPRYAFILCIVGVPANFFFFWYETSLGYWDHFWVRSFFSAALLLIPVVAWLFKSQFIKTAYWEVALLLFFPVMNTLYLLMNEVNKYWFSTYILDMFFLGLFTRYYLLPFHFIVGCGGVTLLHVYLINASGQVYADALQAHTAAILSALVANVFAMVMDYALRKGKQAEAERVRAGVAEHNANSLRKMNDILRTYTRGSLVEHIVNGSDPREIPAVEQEKTILFSDIRDFTGTTERLTPFERLYWLNNYFEMGARCINLAGGEVDKIMGDCVMAVFPNARTALEATLAFRKEIQQFNQKTIELGNDRFVIRSGVGLAQGPVVIGNIGSREKMDLTVIGPAVNIASRIEGLTKVYNLEILVTENIIWELGDYPHCRWVDNVQVKGSKQNFRIYEIYGHQSPEVVRYKDESREILEKALKIYFQRGFNDAHRLFLALQDLVPPHTYLPGEPMDRVCQYFINRCEKLKQDPTLYNHYSKFWQGVHVFDEK